MIGQERVRKLASIALLAGKNLLITGYSGHGKSLLARELVPGAIVISPPKVPTVIPNKIIIVDEIHTTTSKDWPQFLDMCSKSVIFTTTNPEKVEDAIKTRSTILELEPYTMEELALITGLLYPQNIEIASLCRGIPRKAKNLGDIYRHAEMSIEDFQDLLGMSSYKGIKLFPEETVYIQALEKGTASLAVLKNMVQLGNFEEVELSLLRLGLIKITERGRCLQQPIQ